RADILVVSQRAVQHNHKIRSTDHRPRRIDRLGPCRICALIYMAKPITDIHRRSDLPYFGSGDLSSRVAEIRVRQRDTGGGVKRGGRPKVTASFITPKLPNNSASQIS